MLAWNSTAQMRLGFISTAMEVRKRYTNKRVVNFATGHCDFVVLAAGHHPTGGGVKGLTGAPSWRLSSHREQQSCRAESTRYGEEGIGEEDFLRDVLHSCQRRRGRRLAATAIGHGGF